MTPHVGVLGHIQLTHKEVSILIWPELSLPGDSYREQGMQEVCNGGLPAEHTVRVRAMTDV